MKTIAVRQPVLFAMLVSLAGILTQMTPIWLANASEAVQILTSRVAGCLMAVALLAALHWWREAGFIQFTSWRTIVPYLPLLLIAVLYLGLVIATGIKVSSASLIVLGAVSFLAGGFIEEAIWRGLVLRALLPYGLLKAALLSALIFSLVHLVNLLIGQSLVITGLQLANAFLLGFAFVAPLAYTRNIWPLVFIHALLNFSGYLGSGILINNSTQAPDLAQFIPNLVIFGLLAVYGYWLLRRAERTPGNLSISLLNK